LERTLAISAGAERTFAPPGARMTPKQCQAER
jgi:hypothetical protein